MSDLYYLLIVAGLYVSTHLLTAAVARLLTTGSAK
jgi:hypothetical protein